MVDDEESIRKIISELDEKRVMGWTEALKGVAPTSNKQMQLIVRDYPGKYDVFSDIVSFFHKFGDNISEKRLVEIIRSVQNEHCRVNFNTAKLAGIRQYMKFYEQQK